MSLHCLLTVETLPEEAQRVHDPGRPQHEHHADEPAEAVGAVPGMLDKRLVAKLEDLVEAQFCPLLGNGFAQGEIVVNGGVRSRIDSMYSCLPADRGDVVRRMPYDRDAA